MPYDEQLAERVRALVPSLPVAPVRERPMFGGLGFLTDGGHMAVCVAGSGEGLLVRVPAEDSPALRAQDGVGPMVMGGRASASWVVVATGLLTDYDALRAWCRRGDAVAAALPPKER
ncbi:TfoX/Sxy family protein [Nocardioides nanhaiensis]|uniref:TfoX/Sxy family protein n=1 Tax=Nocardioides nanhaiensis TaxID=1476871 RepID=A0ABP8WBN9_9ACTN